MKALSHNVGGESFFLIDNRTVRLNESSASRGALVRGRRASCREVYADWDSASQAFAPDGSLVFDSSGPA
jgi:hypothetical protein